MFDRAVEIGDRLAPLAKDRQESSSLEVDLGVVVSAQWHSPVEVSASAVNVPQAEPDSGAARENIVHS